MAAAILPWRPTYAPIQRPDPSVYSAATIERGRLVAAAGDCAVCHTGPSGLRYAGGRPLDTPFGRVWSANISPHPDTGIGAWSYPAFERSMRDGISRDGHHLYPAHPYTAFAKASDADLQALYAYLMAQPAVATAAPATQLAFPFNLRPLLAGWNALFLRQGVFQPDPARSADWNRGAYLVEGLGHCGGCHSPRNALGAQKTGAAHLAGGFADGWEAPALTALSHAPVPWSEDELFAYLRTGASRFHGVAAGPMAPVVAELAHLPDADIRAMAVYLASIAGPQHGLDEAGLAAQVEQRSGALAGGSMGAPGACAACHEAGAGTGLSNAQVSLALNSNLHSARADNLIQAILRGVPAAAQPGLAAMPGFADSLSDGQVAALASYLRGRFAADKPAWGGLEAKVAEIRGAVAGE